MKEMEDKMEKQRLDYEAAIERQLGFVDRLLADKVRTSYRQFPPQSEQCLTIAPSFSVHSLSVGNSHP